MSASTCDAISRSSNAIVSAASCRPRVSVSKISCFAHPAGTTHPARMSASRNLAPCNPRSNSISPRCAARNELARSCSDNRRMRLLLPVRVVIGVYGFSRTCVKFLVPPIRRGDHGLARGNGRRRCAVEGFTPLIGTIAPCTRGERARLANGNVCGIAPDEKRRLARAEVAPRVRGGRRGRAVGRVAIEVVHAITLPRQARARYVPILSRTRARRGTPHASTVASMALSLRGERPQARHARASVAGLGQRAGGANPRKSK